MDDYPTLRTILGLPGKVLVVSATKCSTIPDTPMRVVLLVGNKVSRVGWKCNGSMHSERTSDPTVGGSSPLRRARLRSRPPGGDEACHGVVRQGEAGLPPHDDTGVESSARASHFSPTIPRPAIAAGGWRFTLSQPAAAPTRPTLRIEWPHASHPPLRSGRHWTCEPLGYAHSSLLSVSASPFPACHPRRARFRFRFRARRHSPKPEPQDQRGRPERRVHDSRS